MPLQENLLEVYSYLVSFGGFYLFVFLARRAVRSPEFRSEGGAWPYLLQLCVGERIDPAEKLQQMGPSESKAGAEPRAPPESFTTAAIHLMFCVVGIQVSYLMWGLMQERIMTKPYATGELFHSSKFLVFANRFLALIVAWVSYRLQRMQGQNLAHTAPLYMFSYSSVSNIMSSVCQYEALKYISFPTQVLSKSCKMVPVMMMGYLVSRKQYSLFEYIVAIMITAGAALFKLYETNDAPVKDTEFVGVAFILGYMVCDSFTSNWQSKVFKQYNVGSITMMMYANFFSSAFTAAGLLVTLEIVQVFKYIVANPLVMHHMVVMSVCSAIGQLFIFHTIKKYGPLVFATIQTVRQLLSIVLSIIFFGHPVNQMEALGILIVFLALGAQIAQKWLNRNTPPSREPLEELKPPKEFNDIRYGSQGASDDEGDKPCGHSSPVGDPSASKEVQALLRKSAH
uniref:Sugar phosphate transporter domain-containing protein n=1 Tax=Chrysotila carterae TaxID=13221 RepID=A0A6S9UV63_CHRCT|mmetsp:Transcript_16706/g.35871  ORF Transcript_16706/g.35871 Transcript_16706/m.35871 type:complete len:454 (+) Transcript_16706:402-1763(+)